MAPLTELLFFCPICETIHEVIRHHVRPVAEPRCDVCNHDLPAADGDDWLTYSRARLRSEDSEHRFSPPWSVEDATACYIVRNCNGQAVAFVYYEEDIGHRTSAKLPTKDEARRIAANVAQLPELLRQ